MSSFLSLLKSLIPRYQSQQERDAAYLGESVDIYDLERRMREIDDRDRGRGRMSALSFGLDAR